MKGMYIGQFRGTDPFTYMNAHFCQTFNPRFWEGKDCSVGWGLSRKIAIAAVFQWHDDAGLMLISVQFAAAMRVKFVPEFAFLPRNQAVYVVDQLVKIQPIPMGLSGQILTGRHTCI